MTSGHYWPGLASPWPSLLPEKKLVERMEFTSVEVISAGENGPSSSFWWATSTWHCELSSQLSLAPNCSWFLRHFVLATFSEDFLPSDSVCQGTCLSWILSIDFLTAFAGENSLAQSMSLFLSWRIARKVFILTNRMLEYLYLQMALSD